jgi:hypothetical protein
MPDHNVHAYTEATPLTGHYPAYLSLNRRDDQSYRLTIRSRGGDDTASIDLTAQQLEYLIWDISADIYRDESKPTAIPQATVSTS